MNNTEQTIKDLNKSLENEEYRQGWIANIAMAQIDKENWYREKYNKIGMLLSYEERHAIANLGAEYFLKLLCKK